LSRVASAVIQLGTTVVLARLLTPEDFGVVALVLAVTGFAVLFVESGIVSAVVQSKRHDDEFFSTAFWMNAAMGIVATVCVATLSPFVAHILSEPSIEWLLPIAGLSFTLSLGVVHSAILQRRLAFRQLSTIAVANTAVNAGTAICAALLGAGALALVLGALAATVTSTALAWIYLPWRPNLRVSRRSASSLWRYTRGLLGYNIVNYWGRNLDNILIGTFLGVAPLGYYSRAYDLMLTPIAQVRSVLYSVMFSTLSRIQGDRDRFAAVWLTGVKASWLLGAPLSLGIAVAAPALVETIFGIRWMPIAPVLALLVGAIPVQIMILNSGAVYQACGETGRQFRLGLVVSAGAVLGISLGLPYGIIGVASGFLASSWGTVWFLLLPAMRLANVRALELGRALAYATLSAFAMAAIALGLRFSLSGHPAAVVLILQLASGSVFYAGCILIGERNFIAAIRGRRPLR
jgi:PST family polysaccharide transporter